MMMAKTNVRGGQIADGANGVDLQVDVTNTLPTVNGGTGLASSGANGNILQSDGSTWQSVVPSSTGGGDTFAFFAG